MASFVLVHGACHGAWCWQKVVDLLEPAGHRVDAIDLPGHGADPRPVAQMTAQDYVDCVIDHVAAKTEPVILAGHSMAGALVTQAAEQIPERLAAVVYVSAFYPLPGPVMPQVAEMIGPRAPIFEAMNPAEDEGIVTIRPGRARDVFYGRCTIEDAAFASALLCPESLAASMHQSIEASSESGPIVPRYFVQCLHDQAFPVAGQRALISARDFARVFVLDADHSPFLCAPEALASALRTVADV